MALFSVCAFWMAGVARLYSSWNKVRRLLSILIHRQVELQEEVVSAALFPQLVSPNIHVPALEHSEGCTLAPYSWMKLHIGTPLSAWVQTRQVHIVVLDSRMKMPQLYPFSIIPKG